MKCGIDVNEDRGEEGGALVREVYVCTIASKRNHQKERRRKASKNRDIVKKPWSKLMLTFQFFYLTPPQSIPCPDSTQRNRRPVNASW